MEGNITARVSFITHSWARWDPSHSPTDLTQCLLEGHASQRSKFCARMWGLPKTEIWDFTYRVAYPSRNPAPNLEDSLYRLHRGATQVKWQIIYPSGGGQTIKVWAFSGTQPSIHEGICGIIIRKRDSTASCDSSSYYFGPWSGICEQVLDRALQVARHPVAHEYNQPSPNNGQTEVLNRGVETYLRYFVIDEPYT